MQPACSSAACAAGRFPGTVSLRQHAKLVCLLPGARCRCGSCRAGSTRGMSARSPFSTPTK